MPDTAGTTGPNTPPRGGNVAPSSEIKSTPVAVGTAAVSENIAAVGTDVSDLVPWVSRDVETYVECEIETMIKELLYRCRDKTMPDPDKSALLRETLNAVLTVCNDGKAAKEIKEFLNHFIDAPDELRSYTYFIAAANKALLQLQKMDVPGIVSSRDDEDMNEILFHHNDNDMNQMHQGEESTRRPDVVVVPRRAAHEVQDNGDLNGRLDVFGKARDKPSKPFQWRNIRSTVEFKCSKRAGRRIKMTRPPTKYEVKDYAAPKEKYMEYRRGMAASAEPTDEAPGPATASDPKPSKEPRHSGRGSNATSGPGPSNEPRASERLNKGSKKRTSDNLGSNNEPDSKRLKRNNGKPKVERKKKHPVVQNGLYAAEMMAAHIARQNVISSIIRNDILYLWYYDRQDAIQCSGFNFIQDLPRFMVLLLIMQRLPYVEWGINPLFARATGAKPEIKVEDKDLGTVDLKFDLEADDRMTHYGLRGRATNVFPVESERLLKLLKEQPSQNTSKEMVAKIFWPEESRESEPDILKKVQAIAERNPDVHGHIPEMVWFHKFDETSTASIRKRLGIDKPERGSRSLYIIVFRRLVPITRLSGDDFLKAWWQVVVCHRILWKNGILHRDISPSNLMVYKNANGEWIGVLNDYDLSSTQQDGPSGNERTGTIPFMAIDLLGEQALKGKVEHLYRHDAESLIWVLAWVCLRYEDGKLRSNIRLDKWLTVDAEQCREKKTTFLFVSRHEEDPSPSHKFNWQTAECCLRQVGRFIHERPAPPSEDEVFDTWLSAHMPPSIRK